MLCAAITGNMGVRCYPLLSAVKQPSAKKQQRCRVAADTDPSMPNLMMALLAGLMALMCICKSSTWGGSWECSLNASATLRTCCASDAKVAYAVFEEEGYRVIHSHGQHTGVSIAVKQPLKVWQVDCPELATGIDGGR
eukprot:3560682-Amphidinium_carterae.1